MYGVALLASTLLSIAGARFYERCELARELLKLGVRRDHIATWVCIAYHESRFDTAARNPSSGDHGLLQISEIYWCGAGKACGLPCSALRDDDISDDVQCAQTIYEEHTRLQGNGFLAWVVYPTYCKHNPKKYLADCDFSVKDGSHSAEERGRSSNAYDPYLTVNQTISNSVQSASYPQSGRPLPGYLAIAALLRGKFESDFERDYNNRYKVNWAQTRPSYLDTPKYDFSSPFTTKRPKTTTTTTTSEPEPYYPPVKPWRVIETNQFRRRKMKFDKAPTETDMVITNFVNTFVRTTPTPTANSITTDIATSAPALSSPSVRVTFENELTTLNSTTERSSTTSSPSFTKQSTPFVSLSTQSFISNTNASKNVTTVKPGRTNPPSTWNAYNRLWTTPLPDFRRTTSTQKPLDTFITNKSTTKPIEHVYKPTSIAPISTTSIKPPKATDKGDNEKVNTSRWRTSAFDISRNKSTTIEVTTMKPTTILTRGSTRTWTVSPLQFQQFYGQNKANGYHFVTESPRTTWRRGKSQPNVFQSSSPFGFNNYYTPTLTTPRTLLYSTPHVLNQSNISNTSTQSSSVSPFITHSTPAITTSTSTPILKPVIEINSKHLQQQQNNNNFTTSTATKQQQNINTFINNKTTEKPSTLPSKTTLSIFDLYLNPTKKSQLPNYSSLFSNKSPSKFKIFSGGTTASPVIGRS